MIEGSGGKRAELGYGARGWRLSAKLATAVVAEALAAVGADAGFVATVAEDGETVNVLRVTPHSESPVPLTFPVSARYPLAAANPDGPTVVHREQRAARVRPPRARAC